MTRNLTILITFLYFIPGVAWAQFYQYTDKNGNVVITDKQPAGSNAQEKQLKDDGIFWSNQRAPEEPVKSGEKKTAEPRQAEKRADYSKATAVMYMTDWCGYCKQARQYIQSLGAGLIEYNIDREPDKKDEMRRKSGGSSSIPLIDIDGTIIRGYSQPAIKAALDSSVSR